MGIEAALGAAGKALFGTAARSAATTAAASLAGSALDRRSQGKAVNQANEAAAARTQAGLSALAPGYQAAQDIRQQAFGTGQRMRQQGMQQGLGMLSQLYGPTANLYQQGNVAAQRALLAGLPLQRAAILGEPMDYSALQPTQISYDPAMLAGIFGGAQLPRGRLNLPPYMAGQAQG
jgi:hypothetical protein